jgi:hypothetical protein
MPSSAALTKFRSVASEKYVRIPTCPLLAINFIQLG